MLMKTHLIVKSQEDEFDVKYVEYLRNLKPIFENDKLVFVVISNKGRTEINTLDINRVVEMTKKYTMPRGRGGLTTDRGYIYVKTEDRGEVLLAVVTHNHIRHYAPMYDEVDIEN